MYTVTVTIGALFRRTVRRTLNTLHDITYIEDRGLLESQFVIKTASKARYDRLMDFFNELRDKARGAL